jgi:hypothetical protein
MPGRPRTTLKRLNDLMQRTASVGDALFTLTPSRYFERPDPTDPTYTAWHLSAGAAMSNYRALHALREIVAEKVARAERLAGAGRENKGPLMLVSPVRTRGDAHTAKSDSQLRDRRGSPRQSMRSHAGLLAMEIRARTVLKTDG